jgi:hypothetical protein
MEKTSQESSSGLFLAVAASALLGAVLVIFVLAFGFGSQIIGNLSKVVIGLVAFLLGLRLLLLGRTRSTKIAADLLVGGSFAFAVGSVLTEALRNG